MIPDLIQQRTIHGHVFLAKFRNNNECLGVDIAGVVDRKVRVFECLVPHGLPQVSWKQPVSQNYCDHAVNFIENYPIESMEIADWDDNLRQCFLTDKRGYIEMPVRNICDWDKADILAAMVKGVSVADALCGMFHYGFWYLSKEENESRKQFCKEWVNTHQNYLENESRKFADFWVNCLETLGSSGDLFADGLHAIQSKNMSGVSRDDRQKLWEVAYNYAIKSLGKARNPLWSVDYAPEGDMADELKNNNISHLRKYFPWKTSYCPDIYQVTASEISND